MRHLIPFFCVLVLLGCNSEVEQRRQHTLERMDYGGGTVESRRVQQLIVTALKQASTTSLQSPYLVNVTMRVVPDDTKRGTLGVNWISTKPRSNGIRIHFSDGSKSDILFDDIENDHNEQESKTLVLFGGNPFVEREHPVIWAKLSTDTNASVALVADGEVVSNKVLIHRVELSD